MELNFDIGLIMNMCNIMEISIFTEQSTYSPLVPFHCLLLLSYTVETFTSYFYFFQINSTSNKTFYLLNHFFMKLFSFSLWKLFENINSIYRACHIVIVKFSL